MKKNIFRKFIVIILTIGVLFSSGYPISKIYSNIEILNDIIFTIPFTFIILFKVRKIKQNIFYISFILLLFSIMVTYIMLDRLNLNLYIPIICKIIIAFGIVNYYSFKEFRGYFLKSMLLISIISILGYILINLNLLNLSIKYNKNMVPYGIGYIFFYIPWTIDRNLGIFWEPGIFATYLSIALIFELFLENKKYNWFRVIIFIITLITTKSAAGYGLLFLITILLIIDKIKSNRKKSRQFFEFIGICIIFLVIINYEALISVFGLEKSIIFKKLIGESLKKQPRVLSIKDNLNKFLVNPFIGIGIKEYYKSVKDGSDTTTSLYMISVYGILGLQYTFYWMYGILRSKIRKNKYFLIMLLIIFLLILNKEPHDRLLFSWIVMFFLLKESVIKNKNKRKINEEPSYCHYVHNSFIKNDGIS